MRDPLCQQKDCNELIRAYDSFIQENNEEIKQLVEDLSKNVQVHPRDNQSIIQELYEINFIYKRDIIRAKYSLGYEIQAIEADFEEALFYLEKMEKDDVGYLNLLMMISLGILLETDQTKMVRLARIVEKGKVNDFVIAFLLRTYQIGLETVNLTFVQELPYVITGDIIVNAEKDKRKASELLYEYVTEYWFHFHYDYGWRSAHEEPGYVGFWSFEAAALAKILNLDDRRLKTNRHYPYDLRHYKNARKFYSMYMSFEMVAALTDERQDEERKAGIPSNPELEEIIPAYYHSFINQLIIDYQTLDVQKFYTKYKETLELDQIWWSFSDFADDHKGKNLLGTLIVFALCKHGYILQLDHKEDVRDFLHVIPRVWEEANDKIIAFILDNDQQYVAWVPATANIDRMYEVEITTIS